MEFQSTFAIYEAVAELTKQMLIAAKQEEWDKLTALEINCEKYIEMIKLFKDELPLTGNMRERKVASIKRILADDREIRDLVSPRMAKLSLLINNGLISKKLKEAYAR